VRPMSTKKNRKNPLNQVFGLVLRQERERRSLTYDHVQQRSGIQTSYFQQIEKGQFHLHVSNCYPLFLAFGKDFGDPRFTLEGLLQMLSIISVLEKSGKEGKNYMASVRQSALVLSEHDPKIHRLFVKFFASGIFETKTNEDATELIIAFDLVNEVRDFLTIYKDFEKSPDERYLEFQKGFFDNVPSIYFQYLKNAKDNILGLPAGISFSGLANWEEQNKGKFTHMMCFCTNPNFITSMDNLSKYFYTYLWEKQFEGLELIFNNGTKPVEQYAEDFSTNLKKSLRKEGKSEMVKRFSDAMSKVKISLISNTKSSKEKIALLLSPPGDARDYSALWIFTMDSGHYVSFLAEIDYPKALVTQGVSLFLNDTAERRKIMKELLRK